LRSWTPEGARFFSLSARCRAYMTDLVPASAAPRRDGKIDTDELNNVFQLLNHRTKKVCSPARIKKAWLVFSTRVRFRRPRSLTHTPVLPPSRALTLRRRLRT